MASPSPSPSPYSYGLNWPHVPLKTGSDKPPSAPLQALTSVSGKRSLQSQSPSPLLQPPTPVWRKNLISSPPLQALTLVSSESSLSLPSSHPLQALPPPVWGENWVSLPPLQALTLVSSPSSFPALTPVSSPSSHPPPMSGERSSSSPPPPPPVQAPPPVWGVSSPPASSKNTKLLAGLSLGIGIPVLLIAVGIFIWYKRMRGRPASAASTVTRLESQQLQPNASPPTRDTTAMLPSGISKTIFTYEELAKATNGFSQANFLGEGGFGDVFKGVLTNGKEVAIKRLKVGSDQGNREFQAEIDTITRVNHTNLVSLAGYCNSETHRLLAYEFVPNKTLKFHLHENESSHLSWGTRMKIALGCAKGLAFLHEKCHPKIIHRDIKSANILLDYNLEAKIADFGLAKFSSDTRTHITTCVKGTFGYLAPEYAGTGKLTDKSDVFSFGVVLLELITGRKPIAKDKVSEDENIVDWARPLLKQAMEDNKFDSLADPRLQKGYDSSEMARMVTCAATCVHHLARSRPRMSQIIIALETGNMSLDDLSDGIRPGHSTIYSSHESVDYDNAQYKEDLKKFRKMALGSQKHGASECSTSGTSDSSQLNPSATDFWER